MVVCNKTALTPLSTNSPRVYLLLSTETSLSSARHAGRDHQHLFHFGEFGTEHYLHVLEHPTVFLFYPRHRPDELALRKYTIEARGNHRIPDCYIIPTLDVLEHTTTIDRASHNPPCPGTLHQHINPAVWIGDQQHPRRMRAHGHDLPDHPFGD